MCKWSICWIREEGQSSLTIIIYPSNTYTDTHLLHSNIWVLGALLDVRDGHDSHDSYDLTLSTRNLTQWHITCIIQLSFKTDITSHRTYLIIHTGCSKKKDQKYWAITQLNKGVLGLYKGSSWPQVPNIWKNASWFLSISLWNSFWGAFIWKEIWQTLVF